MTLNQNFPILAACAPALCVFGMVPESPDRPGPQPWSRLSSMLLRSTDSASFCSRFSCQTFYGYFFPEAFWCSFLDVVIHMLSLHSPYTLTLLVVDIGFAALHEPPPRLLISEPKCRVRSSSSRFSTRADFDDLCTSN